MRTGWSGRLHLVAILLVLIGVTFPLAAAAQRGKPNAGPKSLADLVLSEATAPGSALPSAGIPITFGVNNAGTKTATSVTVHALLGTAAGSVVIGQAAISSLAGGESVSGTFSATVPSGTAPGSYPLTVVVDPSNSLKESDETNNSLKGTISIGAPLTATLSWSPNLEPTVAGYKVHVGTGSRTYGTVIDVGNVTTHALSGLLHEGVTYFFAVSAYDSAGNESPLSEEVFKSFSS